MTITAVTWVTIWAIVALAIISVGHWWRARAHERAAAREFARQLDERDDLMRPLQELDDAAFWDAMLQAKKREGQAP